MTIGGGLIGDSGFGGAVLAGASGVYSAQDIIKAAMRVLGLLAKSETPTADELQDGFQALNFMIDSWSAKRLISTALIKENFPLTANKQSYVIGVGGDFNTVKPIMISSAYYTDNNGIRYPLAIYTRAQYDSFDDADFVQAPPSGIFYDPGQIQQSTQMGTIYVFNIPDSSRPYTLYIQSQKYFTEFVNLTDTVTFPPAYYKALKYGLALEIAPEYGEIVSPVILKVVTDHFDDAMDTLMAVNWESEIANLGLPTGKGQRYNFYSDEAY